MDCEKEATQGNTSEVMGCARFTVGEDAGGLEGWAFEAADLWNSQIAKEFAAS